MGLLDKALEQSQIDNLDSSDVKDVGEACNELSNVRQSIADKEAEVKKLKEDLNLHRVVSPYAIRLCGNMKMP